MTLAPRWKIGRFAAVACWVGLAIIVLGGEARAAKFVGTVTPAPSDPNPTYSDGGGPNGGNYQNPSATRGASDIPNGFSVGGDYSFTAGSSGNVTIDLVTYQLFNVPGGAYTIGESVDSLFSVTGGTATLSSYSVLSESLSPSYSSGDPSAYVIPGSTVNLSLASSVGLTSTPVEISGSAQSSGFEVGTGQYYLYQMTQMVFDTSNGAQVSVNLPNGSGFDPAPEPASLTLIFGALTCGGGAFTWRQLRRRKLVAA